MINSLRSILGRRDDDTSALIANGVNTLQSWTPHFQSIAISLTKLTTESKQDTPERGVAPIRPKGMVVQLSVG